jgi:peptidylprolyl isomerase
MKISAAIFAIALALLSLGCGRDDAASTTEATETAPRLPTVSNGNDPHFATVSGGERGGPEPNIDPPGRAPPEQLLIRDLEVGSGPVAHRGDRVAVRYMGVDYRSGKVRFRDWSYPAPLEYRLGAGGNGAAFEEGIVGMQAGGRRELVIPSRLSYGSDGLDYVVGVARVEPASKPALGG